jgi:hypothetical protein
MLLILSTKTKYAHNFKFITDITGYSIYLGSMSPFEGRRCFSDKCCTEDHESVLDCEFIFDHCRWRYQMKPHFVTDSAFGVIGLVNSVVEWGGEITTAVQLDYESTLWNVLSYNVTPNHWRAAIKGNLVASIHKAIDNNTNKITTQCILSNGFEASRADLVNVQTSTFSRGNFDQILLICAEKIPYMTETTLQAMTVEKLREIAKQHNIKMGTFHAYPN